MTGGVSDYICKVCNKQYKTYKSLWNHNKKYHSIYTPISISLYKPNISQDKSNINQDKPYPNYKCTFCNKVYKHFQSRWKHQQICKNIKYNDTNSIENY